MLMRLDSNNRLFAAIVSGIETAVVCAMFMSGCSCAQRVDLTLREGQTAFAGESRAELNDKSITLATADEFQSRALDVFAIFKQSRVEYVGLLSRSRLQQGANMFHRNTWMIYGPDVGKGKVRVKIASKAPKSRMFASFQVFRKQQSGAAIRISIDGVPVFVERIECLGNRKPTDPLPELDGHSMKELLLLLGDSKRWSK